jgi:hypothetical protein
VLVELGQQRPEPALQLLRPGLGRLATPFRPRPVHRPPKPLLLYRLEQIVQRLHFEGLNRERPGCAVPGPGDERVAGEGELSIRVLRKKREREKLKSGTNQGLLQKGSSPADAR